MPGVTAETPLRTPARTRGQFPPWVVGMIGFALMAYIVMGLLSGADWNPTVFIKFPERATPIQAYGDRQFDDVVSSSDEGHDGKYFFVQAMDPFYLNPQDNAVVLDRPSYRAQRMLYPMVAGGFGLFPSQVTAWALVMFNVLTVGFGTFFTSLVARGLGISSLFGLAFFVNPGVFSSAVIDTADVFALMFLMAAIHMVIQRRLSAAALLFTLAVLSRETMVIAAAGWVLYELLQGKRFARIWALPFVSLAAWWLYLRVRIGYLDSNFQDTRALGLPFRGFGNAIAFWSETPGFVDDMIVGLLLLVTCLLFVYLAVVRRSLIPLLGAGFFILGSFLVGEVWLHYFDSSRALTPIVTLGILSIPYVVRAQPQGYV